MYVGQGDHSVVHDHWWPDRVRAGEVERRSLFLPTFRNVCIRYQEIVQLLLMYVCMYVCMYVFDRYMRQEYSGLVQRDHLSFR